MSGTTGSIDAALAFLPNLFAQPLLAACGFVLLALVPAGLLWARLDARTVNDESVATKPTRFLLSIGVHAVTVSWMFSLVRPERMNAFTPMLAVWMVVVCSAWELACIGWQAARGRESHFNHKTPMDSAIFISMGVFATLLVAGNLPLAWEIVRRPAMDAEPVMVAAVIVGLLVTCFIGGGTGIMMGARNSHGIGHERKRLPLLGWSADAGDLRPPHFLSIHALQAYSLLAWIAALASERHAPAIFSIAAVGYSLLIGGTFVQALRGHPLIPVRAIV